MPPLHLYARVRTSSCTLHTRPRVPRAPGIPCALLFSGVTAIQDSAHRAARPQGHASCDPNQRIGWLDEGKSLEYKGKVWLGN